MSSNQHQQPYPCADLLSASCGVLLAGQEDQLQIDGINRLIKAMQEIASPTAAAVPAKTKAAQPSTFTVAITDSSGRLISYTGNTSVVAQSSNTSAVARSGNMQTAAMRTSAPVSTSNPVDAPATAASRSVQSSSSLDRSQAVQGSNPVEAIQQTVQMLQWFVQEASQLPPAARLEALRYGPALISFMVFCMISDHCGCSKSVRMRIAARPV